ncbi:hypothetical protein PanWU01x14_287050 [Parasponia andersonii]|uniref:Uncharacterized protein n=1 Tax=Parasponia andersonii TaxID=3476 RepID=A0A2P5AYW4_PARAD|nr:hypothetical protein PanWU01x14_287050 [Parasponia andersonii]
MLGIGGTELGVATMTLELEISIKNAIRRFEELNLFKDSGSVKVGEIEQLQEAGEELRKSYEDPNGKLAKILRDYSRYKDGENRKPSKKNKQELERLMVEMEAQKTEVETLYASLDVHEERFRKFNVPKRFQMASEQPLKLYLESLQEFMKTTWRKESEKNREKEKRSLIEWMDKVDQSNEEAKFAFDALKTSFAELGIQISKFFIDYFLLIMAVSNKSEEILALSLYEVEAGLECLNVEENSSSIVINTFIKMVQFFERSTKLAGPVSDEAKGQKSKEDSTDDEEKVMFFLDDEIKDDLLHPIIIEVLRLEVSFCSPEMPVMVTSDVFYSMARHLVDNVFEDKFNRIGAKIHGLKTDIQFVQGEDSSEVKFFRDVLDSGVKELWTSLDPKPGS